MLFPKRRFHLCMNFIVKRCGGDICPSSVFCLYFCFFTTSIILIFIAWRKSFTVSYVTSYRIGSRNASAAGWVNEDILTLTLRDDFTYCPHTTPFVGHYSYTPLSRSPCWQDGYSFQCVAHFYITGFSKCGTSDLHKRLARHPDILMEKKEMHWFDFWRNIAGYDTIKTYAKHFTKASADIAKDIADYGHSKKIIGDATPCTAWSSLYWRCYQGNEFQHTEPLYTNADIIHRFNPNAKLIFLMRDPVERLYSRYQSWISRVSHFAYTDPSPERFHSLAMRAITRYKQCFCQWSLRSCAYNGTLYADVMLRLQEGMYSVFLQDWLSVFPRKQLFFIKFEDYVHDIASWLQAVIDFLELADPGVPWYIDTSSLAANNRGNNSLAPMLPETRKALKNFYDSVNTHLPNLLDDTRFKW